MKKQVAENIKPGLIADSMEFLVTAAACNTIEPKAIAADSIINQQLYQQNKPKDLPQGKMYQRKLGWRILPIVSNSEKNLRH